MRLAPKSDEQLFGAGIIHGFRFPVSPTCPITLTVDASSHQFYNVSGPMLYTRTVFDDFITNRSWAAKLLPPPAKTLQEEPKRAW